MATTTADSIRLSESSQTPEAPEKSYGLSPLDSTEYLALLDRQTPIEAELVVDRRPAQPEAPQQASPISIIVDAEGQYVAQDTLGAVYGVGPTPQAAVADFYDALRRRLSLLRTRLDQLHPALARELRDLERLFPGQ
jgi:hypothetical protein